MKHQKIDRAARVWMVSRGPDGRLQEQLDAELLERLNTADTDEIAEAIIRTAAEAEISKIRAW